MVWYNNSINLSMGWIYEVFGGATFVIFCFPVFYQFPEFDADFENSMCMLIIENQL